MCHVSIIKDHTDPTDSSLLGHDTAESSKIRVTQKRQESLTQHCITYDKNTLATSTLPMRGYRASLHAAYPGRPMHRWDDNIKMDL
jgi:hypothetical protein